MKEIHRISIEQKDCIQCGRCAQVCPSEIMKQDKESKEIQLEGIENCIVCGHCVDVCPKDAVLHSAFPLEKIHRIDYSLMPSPEQLLLLIKSRRSNRVISSKPIPEHHLDMIIQAARYAPTATNSKQVSFSMIKDPEKLRCVSDFTIDVFDSVKRKLTSPLLKPLVKIFLPDIYKMLPKFERLKQQDLAGKDPILRGATAVLFIHTPKKNRFASEDANLAYQNASLMAQSLGISQIYMGFVLSAIEQNNRNSLAKSLGIDGRIHAVMALGIPSYMYPKYTEA